MGKPYSEVRAELEFLKRKHQLDFNILPLKLEANTINELLELQRRKKEKDTKELDWENSGNGCCQTDIKENYLQLRNEIIAEVEKYNWIITKLVYILNNSQQVTAQLMQGGKMTAGTMAEGIFDIITKIDEVAVLISSLPKCIEEFDLDVFIKAFKGVQEMAYIVSVVFERWLRLSPILGPYAQYMIERFLLVNYGFVGSIYDLNDILRSNLDVQMRSVYHSYLQRLVKAEQSNVFGGFAFNNPGLEHMAGVPKGGTFIMVYGKESKNIEDQMVVADFALNDKVCCDGNFSFCDLSAETYNPVAKNVYFFLDDKTDQGEVVEIDVLEFALDLNVEEIDIVPFPENSVSGRKSRIRRIDNELLGRAVVEYVLVDNFGTAIDRFDYTIKNKISGKTDTGCVFVALIPGATNSLLNMDNTTGGTGTSDISGGTVIIDSDIISGGDIVTGEPPVIGGGVGPDYGKNYDLDMAYVHENLIVDRDNVAKDLIDKTKERYKDLDKMGKLNPDAIAEVKGKYEADVIKGFKDIMKDTTDSIHAIDLQIGDEPTNLKAKLEYKLEFEAKFAARNALITVYENQTKALAKVVAEEGLATEKDSDMYKFIDVEVRSQTEAISIHSKTPKSAFIELGNKEGVNDVSKELFDSFDLQF